MASEGESTDGIVDKRRRVGVDRTKHEHVLSAVAQELHGRPDFRLEDAIHGSTGWQGIDDKLPETFCADGITQHQHLLAYRVLGYTIRERGDKK